MQRGGVAALKIWQKSFLKSFFLFIGVSFFLRLPLSSCGRGWGVAMLKIWQKSFLYSFFFLSAFLSFCGCRYFVRQRGALRSKSGKNLFYNLFSFYRRFFLFVVAASSCGRGWGVAALKIWQNLFYNLFSFYRRFFLFAVAAGCAAAVGGRYAQNLAKSFFKIFFLFIGECFYLCELLAQGNCEANYANAATSCGRGWGSLRSKSGKNLF